MNMVEAKQEREFDPWDQVQARGKRVKTRRML
jgi:hypothetical protein